MSTRFYAGAISSGMGHSCEDCVEPGPAIEAQRRRWRTALVRARVTLPIRSAPPGPPQPLGEPTAPIASIAQLS